MASNGSLSTEANIDYFVTEDITVTATTWVTEYDNRTGNNTTCPIYVQKVHILPNPWDDATWILTSAFVIFTMQSGFGLLESGTATAKNEVNIMVKNAVDVIFGGIGYWIAGYAFSFGDAPQSNAFSGWGNFFLTVGMNDTTTEMLGWEYSNFIFQLAFATTATTIVSGAMVERTRLEGYIIFSLTNTIVYSFPSHWVWAPNGFLKVLGCVDIAGAGPVHIAGGTTGLIATLVLRPRHRRYKTATPPPMGSPTNALLGMFMLWWGWLGFNCGSTHGITSSKWALAARSAVSTICSSMAGGMVGIFLSYISKRRKFDIGYLINGVLGSLVSITALCTLCPPKYSLIIGAIGGAISCGGIELLIWFHVDDPVGVIPVHFFCGVWSLLSAGLFATKEPEIPQNYNGLFFGGGFYLLGVQVASALCIIVWCAVLSFIVLKIIDYTIGLRFPFQEELLGADIVEHSIGPRKYDKIKKRLTDLSRVRAYDMRPRKRYNASFKAAERYLSQRDAGVLSVENDIEAPSRVRGRRDKAETNRKKKTSPYLKTAKVFSISNGNRHGVNTSNNGAAKHMAEFELGLHGLPIAGSRSPRLSRRQDGRHSMAQLHGALRRRRRTKVPKWQQQLGVDNLAYLKQEENGMNGFIKHSVTIETDHVDDTDNNATRSNISHESSANDVNLHMADINLMIKRGTMVDSCTQTSRQFEQEIEYCQHCQQTKDGGTKVDEGQVEHGEMSSAELNSVYACAIDVPKIESSETYDNEESAFTASDWTEEYIV